MTTMDHRDATGAPIVVGRRYGYSSSGASTTNVVIGRVTKADPTKDGIRFKPESEQSYIYGRPYKPDQRKAPVERSVRSLSLFPLPTVEENDLGRGLTLDLLWKELDTVIGGLNELEERETDPYWKRRTGQLNDIARGVFQRVQGAIDDEQARQHRILYKRWQADPTSVDDGWARFFTEATPEELKPYLEQA